MRRIFASLLLTGIACLHILAADGFVGTTWLDPGYVDEDGYLNFGNGTQSNPWQIRSAGALAYLAREVNQRGNTFEGKYFVIARNIDLNGLDAQGNPLVWVPIGLDDDHPFKGTITNGTYTDEAGNEQPCVISGMTIRADGTGTTETFGLFGLLQGTVEGLVIRNANIVVNTSDRFQAGTLCGELGTSAVGQAVGTVHRCTVEEASISANSTNSRTSVGGMIGTVWNITKIESNLAKTTIRATGPISTGGVFGDVYADAAISDCHAVVEMTVKNDTDEEAAAGGVTGLCDGTYSRYDKTELLACSASGDIAVRGDGSNVIVGGITGHAQSLQKLTYCTTSVSLSGAHTMGGLIGYYQDLRASSSQGILECFCSSFVDAKQATYAGGLFGRLSFSFRYSGSYYVGYMSNSSVFTTFAGTMTKPESSDSRYGIIVGYVERDQDPDNFGYFKYDRKMCNLQLNGMGWNSERWGSTSDYRLVITFDSPKPQDGVYAYYQEAWMGQLYQHLSGDEPFYTANMKVACAPLIITNDYKNYFNAYDVTIDFLVEKFVNQTTGEELATYQLASPTPPCLKLNGNKAKLLDPGEAVVIVNCRGVQRKVHLDITYGVPWDGYAAGSWNWNDFIGGDGTAKNPYVIHNVQELLRVIANKEEYLGEYRYNVEGMHYILTNDIFMNTHLLTDDEQPRDDARPWRGTEWNAILHGNGKTIYGLKSVKTEPDSDESTLSGLFKRVSGTIEDLAVVDAYVQAAGSSSGISAGIICGELLENGSIERCLVHGAVQSNGYAGGICGNAGASCTRIADCFAAVHIGWPGNPESYIGAGIAGAAPDELVRCVSTCKVESHDSEYGITRDESRATDCWFDRQMMSQDDASKGSTYTKDMIGGKILAGISNWHTEENRYPMLRQFVGTTYGDLLAAPVFFADNRDVDAEAAIDRAGYVTQIFDLPTENIVWRARLGSQHLDVINECGAGTPNGRISGEPDHLIGETASTASLCTRAKHCIAVDVMTDKAGIKFKDSHTEAACLAAFDADSDGLIILREAFTANAQKFAVFNANDEAKNAESFTEMRYFAGITDLQENILSGLTKLRELELPRVLTTVSPNAFNGCMSLESVTLPHTFRTATGEGFYGSAIRDILVNEKNPLCKSIDGALYQINDIDDTKVDLMAYPPGRSEASATLSVPLSMIGSKAFYRVPELDNVYIDNCLPEGNMAELADPEDEEWYNSDAIIHYDDEDDTDEPQMHIYVNDGSFNSRLFGEYNGDPNSYWQPYADNDRLDIYYPLTVTSALWATLYIDFDTELPEGLTAYIACEPDTLNNIVELNSIGRLMPRSTPVAIKAEAPGIYPLYKYPDALEPIEMWTNRFIGSYIGQNKDGQPAFGVPVNQETAVEGSILTLGRNKNGQVGFFKYNGQEIPPYRAYLTRNNVIEGPTALMVKVGRDLATEIAEALHAQPRQATGAYTIDGRRLNGLPTQRGLYIINGKKVVVK